MENTPNVRFKGFADDWEQRKLGEVFEEYSEKNHPELSPLTIIQGGGTILREESNRTLQYDKSSLSGYKMVQRDDFIVHLRSFEGGLEKANSDGIISPAYHTFRGIDTDSRFYYPFFRSRHFIDVLLKPHVYGIRDGKSIDIDGMKTIMIPVPSYEEQKKIGKYIENLDHLITLHQCKCDEMKQLKRFMLQKMFPKSGELIPEIRFAGFTDAWEQCKLGEVAGRTYGGGTPKTTVVEYWDGDIPWIQSSNLTEHELFNSNIQKYITDEGLAKSATQLVPPNSIAVVSHVGVGKLVFMPFSYTTSQDFISLSELKAEPIFTCYSIYKRLQNDIHIVQGSAIKGITKDDLLSKEILIPSKPEQAKIGMYFRQLDNLITLHQRKCDNLKEVKRFMLQNMFPQKG